MANRTIPTVETYPIIGDLIRTFPELFNIIEICGVFEGTYGVSSILLNASYVSKVDMYENFAFTKNIQIRKEFSEMYNYWQHKIPNLKIHLTSGDNFYGNSNFMLIDCENIKTFVTRHRDKLKQTLCVSPGFLNHYDSTKNLFSAIYDKKIIPVLIYRDYLFYTLKEKQYNYVYNKISDYILQNYECEIIKDKFNLINVLNSDLSDSIEVANYTDRIKQINDQLF